ADERARQVVVVEPGSLEHGARGRAFDAVGERRAVALRGVGRPLVGVRQSVPAPAGETSSGRTSASGKRAARAAAQAAVPSRSAQTITVGPEPDRVAPSAPWGRLSRAAARS